MSFKEVRLPEDIERGASGGPRFNTSITQLISGYEQRNQNWSQSRAEWDISYGIQSKEDYSRLLNFFYARRGAAIGFRFRDWADYEVTMAHFVTGDGMSDGGNPANITGTTTFQLVKNYEELDEIIYTREILKPVQDTVQIFDNMGDELTEGFTIDYVTGKVVFDTAPLVGVQYFWSGEFDIPVRFSADNLDLNIQWVDAASIPSITIVELRI